VGLVSDESVKSLGNMLGADAIIMGTFTDLGEAVDLNCRIIEPESGRILGSANVTIAQNKVVKRLWRHSDGSGNNLVVTSQKSDSGSSSSIVPWITGGLSVIAAGLGTGIGVGIMNDLELPPTSPDYERNVEGAQGRAAIASISFGVAGVSAGVTLLMMILGGDSNSDGGQAAIMPIIGDDHIGVGIGKTIDW